MQFIRVIKLLIVFGLLAALAALPAAASAAGSGSSTGYRFDERQEQYIAGLDYGPACIDFLSTSFGGGCFNVDPRATFVQATINDNTSTNTSGQVIFYSDLGATASGVGQPSTTVHFCGTTGTLQLPPHTTEIYVEADGPLNASVSQCGGSSSAASSGIVRLAQAIPDNDGVGPPCCLSQLSDPTGTSNASVFFGSRPGQNQFEVGVCNPNSSPAYQYAEVGSASGAGAGSAGQCPRAGSATAPVANPSGNPPPVPVPNPGPLPGPVPNPGGVIPNPGNGIPNPGPVPNPGGGIPNPGPLPLPTTGVPLPIPSVQTGGYKKVADPTGKVAGAQGGVVVGSTQGHEVEVGLCTKGDGALPAGYNYGWVDPSGQATNSKASCNGDPPLAQTDPAVVISARSVDLAATVNTNHLATSWWFELGRTTNYSISFDPQNLAASDSDQHPDLTLSDLRPGTTYHYRVVAKNAAGTTDGPDVTFTTPLS